jgi:hypothetical protein
MRLETAKRPSVFKISISSILGLLGILPGVAFDAMNLIRTRGSFTGSLSGLVELILTPF